MKFITLMTATTIAVFHTTGAWSADYEVQRTLQLPSSTYEVWNLVGDFCDFDDWHPDLTACSLKVIDGGIHRILTTENGEKIVHKRIAVEPGLSYTYKITSSHLPLENYIATFSIDTTSGSLIGWYVRFSSDDPTMEAAVGEFFETGLSAIESAINEQ